MVVCILAVVLGALTTLALRYQNKQVDEGKRVNEGMVGFKYTW